MFASPKAVEDAAELDDESKHVTPPECADLMAKEKAIGKYAIPMRKSVKIVLKRQMRVILRNKAFVKARIAQNIMMGLIFGMLLWQLGFDEWFVKAMLMFSFLQFLGFSSLALIPVTCQMRDIYYKHRRQHFYPAFALVLSDWLAAVPFSLFDVSVLGSIVYFMCGLTLVDGGQHYFIWLIIGFSYALAVGQLVRTIAYAMPNATVAQGVSVFWLVIFIFYSGGVATRT